MPMPRHGLWSNDTIRSCAQIPTKAGLKVHDDSNHDSDEDEDDGVDRLPDYLGSNGVQSHAI